MMNRVVGLLVSVTWAVAFAALMARDVVPL
jgi:hypothetical protein